MKQSRAPLLGLYLVILGSLAACDQTAPAPRPLTAAERAASLVELIEHREECQGIRKKLAVPNPDAQTVDQLYHEAIKAKCLEKDV